MKKLFISACISLLVLVGISFPVFCEDEPYVPSVGVRTDVGIEGGEVNPETGCYEIWDWCEDCHRKLVVTPYYLKDTIESDHSKELIDIAYDEIVNADKVYDLTEDVIAVAHSVGADENDLVIRDVFDITDYYCDLQSNTVELTLTTEQLNNYVCLLHYKEDHWEVVPDAYVTIDDNHLYLRVDSLSPFAIVVTTAYNYVAPSEDDGGGEVTPTKGCIWHWFIAITCLITFVIGQVKRKKDYDKDMSEEDRKELDKKNKKVVRFRNILSVINLILCVIFFILGSCRWDLIALVVDAVVLVLMLYYSLRNNNKQENE